MLFKKLAVYLSYKLKIMTKNKIKKQDANGNPLPEKIGKGLTEHGKKFLRKPFMFSLNDFEKENLERLAQEESEKQNKYISASELIRLKLKL